MSENKLLYVTNNQFVSGMDGDDSLKVVAVRLLNFKAFVDSGWIEFNKITMLLGRNSIGKSSITQALQMIRICYEKMMQGRIQPGLLSLDDSFGNFSDIKNQGVNGNSFSIIFKMENGDAVYEYDVMVDENNDEVGVRISLRDEKELYTVDHSDEIDNIFFAHLGNQMAISDKTRLSMRAVNSVKDFASSLEFVGPSRSIPKRQFSVSGTMAPGVGIMGDNTYDILFYLSQIKHEVPKAIQDWLSLFGYELLWKSSGDNKNEGGFWLKNKKTHNITNIVDNGFGIQQSLPVVLALTLKDQGLLVVDTPEAHLQAPIESYLADIIIEAQRENTRLILETGSEQILMRIRKLVSAKSIESDKVSCYFIDETEGDNLTKCEKLQISSEGILDAKGTAFADFFAETANDLMEIKKNQYDRIRKMK